MIASAKFEDFLSNVYGTAIRGLDDMQPAIFLEDGEDAELSVEFHQSVESLSPTPQQPGVYYSTTITPSGAWQSRQLRNVDDLQALFSQPLSNLAIFRIGQQHSRSRIDMTYEVFRRLMDNLQSFSAVEDAIKFFGVRSTELEIAPPRLRYNILYDVGRCQSQGFETVYGLRFIEPNGRVGGSSWSMRQFVVYNKTIHLDNSSHWLFFSLPEVMYGKLQSFLRNRTENTKLHPLEIHLILVTMAVQMWRPYLAWAVKIVDGYRRAVSVADERGNGLVKLDGSRSNEIRNFEDLINDAHLAITATLDLVNSLLYFYEKVEKLEQPTYFYAGQQFPYHTHHILVDRRKDLEMLQYQTVALLRKLKTASRVVSSFLSLANGHSMRELSVQGGLEARSVKALSVVTLIYLPTTVVLNFFSAAFVDTSPGYMRLLDGWWLFIVIGIPLTTFTLAAWTIWTGRLNVRDLLSSWNCLGRTKRADEENVATTS